MLFLGFLFNKIERICFWGLLRVRHERMNWPDRPSKYDLPQTLNGVGRIVWSGVEVGFTFAIKEQKVKAACTRPSLSPSLPIIIIFHLEFLSHKIVTRRN